jgi:hypothetical protein
MRPCDDTLGLECHYATGTCRKIPDVGASCTSDLDCQVDQLGRAGVVGMRGTDYPTTPGEACDYTGAGCSFLFGGGLTCTPENRCAYPGEAKVGEVCGYRGDGLLYVCEPGSLCDGRLDGWNGVCVAGEAGDAGEACAYTPCGPGCEWTGWSVNGPECTYGSRCVTGTCVTDDPESCR